MPLLRRLEAAHLGAWTRSAPLAFLVGACAAGPPPQLPAGAAAGPRAPVVFVPGVTGTVLRDSASGRVVWGDGRSIFWPRDGGYRLTPSLGGAEDPIEPWTVLREVRLGPLVRKPIYQPLVDALAGAGYTLGDLARPRPGDDLFLFAYDWRGDNVDAAARLAAGLARLRTARGGSELAIDLVCQSNGAHVCRYLAKYGGADLAAAQDGPPAPVAGVRVRRLILVGASNGGALRILRELNRGRRYVVAGRRFLPEVFFAMEALYQDLPAAADDLFVDVAGASLALDLYDPASWERWGWSVWEPAAARRADRRPDLFATPAERHAFLGAALARARQLQAVLARDSPGFGAAALYLLENGDEATPVRAVLSSGGGRPRTLFPDDDFVARRPQLAARLVAPGDGHASLASQRHLSPQELAALAEPPRPVHGAHFETIVDPATLGEIVAILTGDGTEAGAPGG